MQFRHDQQDCPFCGCDDTYLITSRGLEVGGQIARWIVTDERCDHECTLSQHGICLQRSGSDKDRERGRIQPPASARRL